MGTNNIAEKRCHWCGASYEAGTYRAHTGGQVHREWLAAQRQRRARWRGVAAYKQSLRDEKSADQEGVQIDLWEWQEACALYLYRVGEEWAIAGLQYTGSTFAEDAARLAAIGPRWLTTEPEGLIKECEPRGVGAAFVSLPTGWAVDVFPVAELDSAKARIIANWNDGQVRFLQQSLSRTAGKYLWPAVAQAGRMSRAAYASIRDGESR